ncbi:MAG TPA: tetratricopeptide repeat protein [Terrimicrobium sp.]
MKTASTGFPVIRIFLSSPGDVAHERRIAREVISRLNAEFAERVVLETYFWEYEPFDFSKSFQAQIPNPADFDVVLCFLWSRLGSRLHSASKLPDGTPAQSGTEYEIAHALEGQKRRAGLPELHVWINRTIPPFPPDPPEVHDERIAQWRALKQFIDRWTRDTSEDVFVGSFTDYKTLAEFEELIEIKLRKIVDRRCPELPERGTSEIPVRATWTAGSPFRGLEPFEFEHAPIFFGRTGEIGAALESLRKTQIDKDDPRGFLLMLGASGSGKSSLARAGVMPTLVEPGVIDGIGLWRRAVMKPSDAEGNVFLGLAQTVLGESGLPELVVHGSTAETLADRFQQGGAEAVIEKIQSGLLIASERERARQEVEVSELIHRYRAENRNADAKALEARLRTLAPPKPCLTLLIDQLDELFTGDVSPENRGVFVETMSRLARSGFAVILTTLRSDFYHRVAEYPVLLELAQGTASYHLAPPTLVEIGQIIRKPAQVAGLRFDVEPQNRQSLDEALRDAAAQDPQVLPLLEFALEELYVRQAQRGDGFLRWVDYESFKRLEGVIAHKADECLAVLPQDRQATCLNAVFGKLLSLSTGANVPVRRTALYDDLLLNPYRKSETDPSELPGARTLVDSFIDARLLVATQAENGKRAVSVAHEALLRSWPRLKSWIASNREKLRIRNQVDRSQADWLANGKDPSLLLAAGLPLNLAEKLQKESPELLSRDLEEYISASLNHDRAQRQRKRYTIGAVIGGLSVLGIIATVAGVFAARNARQAIVERDRAENLVSFMVYDLQKKLEPIGRLELLKDIHQRTFEYFEGVGETADARSLDRKTDALINRGVQLFAAGQLPEARRSFEQAVDLSRKLAAENRSETGWQHNLATSYQQIGNVLAAEGNLTKAFEAYEDSRKILQELIEQDPANSLWQRDLAGALEKIGDVQSRQGKLAEALQTHQKARDIRRAFSEKNPEENQWRRDLAISDAKVGGVLMRQGKLNEAYQAFKSSHELVDSLTKLDPNNLTWQSDLATTFLRIGDLLTRQGKLSEAFQAYQHGYVIRKSLVERDSANSIWQNDLSISLSKVGDVLEAQGKHEEAVKVYYESLEIRKLLAHQNPSNATLQSGISINLEKVGDVLMAENKIAQALGVYQQTLAIRRTLADKDPSHAGWKRGLCSSLEKLGDALTKLERTDEAQNAYSEALQIRETLADQDISNLGARHELSTVLEKLGKLYLSQDKIQDAVRSYTESLKVREELANREPGSAEWQKGLAQVLGQLGEIAQKQGQNDLAKQHYQRSLEIRQTLTNPDGQKSDTSEDIIKLQGQLDALTDPAIAPPQDSVASP